MMMMMMMLLLLHFAIIDATSSSGVKRTWAKLQSFLEQAYEIGLASWSKRHTSIRIFSARNFLVHAGSFAIPIR